MIYVFTTLFSIILAFFISILNVSRRIKKALYILSFVPLTYLGAVRYFVGLDYYWYSLNQIPAVLRGSSTVKFEYLAKQVVYLGDYLADGQHYIYIFAMFHIIIMYFMYKYIVNASPYIGLSIFFAVGTAFYNFGLSGMRQVMATSIAFYALVKLKEKKYIYFLALIAVATLFHTSAIIYLIFILLDRISISNKLMVFGVGVAIVLVNTGSYLISYLMELLGFYEEYVGSEQFYGKFQNLHQIYTVALTLLVICALLFASNDFKKENRIYININYLLLIVAILMSIIPTPSRIIFMFIPAEFVLIPKLISEINKTRGNAELKIIITLATIVITCAFYYIFIIVRNSYGTLPYTSIFD